MAELQATAPSGVQGELKRLHTHVRLAAPALLTFPQLSGMADAPTDWLVALGYGPAASAAPALPPEPPPAVLALVA